MLIPWDTFKTLNHYSVEEKFIAMDDKERVSLENISKWNEMGKKVLYKSKMWVLSSGDLVSCSELDIKILKEA